MSAWIPSQFFQTELRLRILAGIEKRKQNYAKHSVVLLEVRKDPSVAAKQSPCCKRFMSMSRISEEIFSTRKHSNLGRGMVSSPERIQPQKNLQAACFL